MTLLPLFRGGIVVAHAIVDEDDAEWLSEWTWRLSLGGYAWRTEYRPQTINIFIHRLILALPHGDPRFSDHINRDRLDNRRANLRIVTKQQNAQNQGLFRDGASRFRGVDFKKGKWRARVTLGGHQHHLGYFATEEEAAAAARAYRADHMPYSAEDAA